MLEQTRHATSSLLKAGLDRKDFRVRTERLMNGKQFRGYGDAFITIWNTEKAVACTEAMRREGLSVSHVLMTAEITLVFVRDDGNGLFEVTDYRNVEVSLKGKTNE